MTTEMGKISKRDILLVAPQKSQCHWAAKNGDQVEHFSPWPGCSSQGWQLLTPHAPHIRVLSNGHEHKAENSPGKKLKLSTKNNNLSEIPPGKTELVFPEKPPAKTGKKIWHWHFLTEQYFAKRTVVSPKIETTFFVLKNGSVTCN